MELNEHNKQEYPPMHTYEVHFSFFRHKNKRRWRTNKYKKNY